MAIAVGLRVGCAARGRFRPDRFERCLIGGAPAQRRDFAVGQQPGEFAQQLIEVDGFGDVGVAAGFQRRGAVTGQRIGRNRQDRQGQAFAAQDAGGFQAVEVRHVNVHQNGVVVAGRRPGNGFATIFGDLHLRAGPLQELQRQLLVDGIVLGDQQSSTQQCRHVALAPGGRFGRLGLGAGQCQLDGEAEGAALAGLGSHFDGAAHYLDQALADGEAEPGAAEAAGRRQLGLFE